jgi:hypothetical protein
MLKFQLDGVIGMALMYHALQTMRANPVTKRKAGYPMRTAPVRVLEAGNCTSRLSAWLNGRVYG